MIIIIIGVVAAMLIAGLVYGLIRRNDDGGK